MRARTRATRRLWIAIAIAGAGACGLDSPTGPAAPAAPSMTASSGGGAPAPKPSDGMPPSASAAGTTSTAPAPTATPTAGSSAMPVAQMAMPTQMAGASGTASGEGGNNGGAGGANAPTPATGAKFELMPVDFPMVQGEWAFPPSALGGSNVSPAWSWTGVPADAKSLVLVFEDVGISAVKWVVWDIPPDVTMLPAGIDDSTTLLTEVPGASQLGSLGNTGYAGPVRPNLPYEWTLWALDVDKLPDTQGKSTVDIKAALPMHMVAKADTVTVYNR